eukprot:TRINITY_DN5502_c0_g1_i2.p1 TRINITY_DN5502_c0_g1~~TRINITY_DN5502_c0_g1_i2.p1  ORF type:complete len:383 (+),score=107.82 TRINITY_DN5502_c0_g1_i2:106-1149(+)
MSIPTTTKVAASTEQKTVEVKEIPLAPFSQDQVLVKIHASGINPTDWKHTKFGLCGPNTATGCDYAGEVVAVGSNVKGVKVGDRLGGFLHGNNNQSQNIGAFSQYAPVDPLVAFKIPEGTSYEEAASLPIPFFTAAHSLFYFLKLSESRQSQNEWVLVWSGATAVGFNTIQLAKLYGYKVVTTASPSNHETLKAAGADLVFDYNDKDVVQKIREATNESVKYAVDSISEENTVKQTAASLGPNGQVVLVLSPKLDGVERKDVKFHNVLLYTSLGKELHIFGSHVPPQPEHRAFQERWQPILEGILKEKQLKFLNLEDRGGLSGVESAYNDMAAGKNRATKYIIHPQA